MAADLDRYFVKFVVLENDQVIEELICPKSLIHTMFLKWKFPGSRYNVKVIDHTNNFRIDSKIMDGHF
jgi:hypothetical protein